MFHERRPFRRPALTLLAVVASLAVMACGEEVDGAGTTTVAPTTATTASTSTSTTTTAGTSGGTGSSMPEPTATSGTVNPDEVDLFLGAEQRKLLIDGCTASEGSLELTAKDPAGNTLTVTVHDGAGGVTYRGPSEDREGSVRSADVRADGAFVLRGIISVADDSSPAPVGLQVAGRCTP